MHKIHCHRTNNYFITSQIGLDSIIERTTALKMMLEEYQYFYSENVSEINFKL